MADGGSLGALGGTTVEIRGDVEPLKADFRHAESLAKRFASRVHATLKVTGLVEGFGKAANVAGFISGNKAITAVGKAATAATAPVKALGEGLTSVGGAIALIGLVAGGTVGKLARLAGAVGAVVGIGVKLTGVIAGLGVALLGVAARIGTVAAIAVGTAISVTAKLASAVVGAVTGVIGAIGDLIGSVVNGLGNAIGSVFKAVGALSDAFFGVLRTVGKLTLAVGAALSATGYALYRIVKTASDLNETLNKTKEVFKGSTAVVVKSADEMQKAFGVPKREFLDAASSLGLVARASGYSEAKAAALATQLAKLAVDASSFYNVPLEDALIAMRAGLVGEAEPLRRYGVLLDEVSVAQQAFKMGLAKTRTELTQGMKVQARAALIIAGMATASGDLKRTQGDLANKMREVSGRFHAMVETLGGFLMPLAKAVATSLSSIAQQMTAMLQRHSAEIKAFIARITPYANLLGDVFKHWPEYLELAKAYAVDAFIKIQEVLRRLGIIAKNVFAAFVATAVDAFGALKDAVVPLLAQAGDKIKETLSFSIAEGVKQGLATARKAVVDFMADQIKKQMSPEGIGEMNMNMKQWVGMKAVKAAGGMMPEVPAAGQSKETGLAYIVDEIKNRFIRMFSGQDERELKARMAAKGRPLAESGFNLGIGGAGGAGAGEVPLPAGPAARPIEGAPGGGRLAGAIAMLGRVQAAATNAWKAVQGAGMGRFNRAAMMQGLPGHWNAAGMIDRSEGLFGNLPGNAAGIAGARFNLGMARVASTKTGLGERMTGFASGLGERFAANRAARGPGTARDQLNAMLKSEAPGKMTARDRDYIAGFTDPRGQAFGPEADEAREGRRQEVLNRLGTFRGTESQAAGILRARQRNAARRAMLTPQYEAAATPTARTAPAAAGLALGNAVAKGIERLGGGAKAQGIARIAGAVVGGGGIQGLGAFAARVPGTGRRRGRRGAGAARGPITPEAPLEPFQSQIIDPLDFVRQAQTSALSREGGDGKDVAKNTKDSAGYLKDITEKGIKIQGGIPAVAMGPES